MAPDPSDRETPRDALPPAHDPHAVDRLTREVGGLRATLKAGLAACHTRIDAVLAAMGAANVAEARKKFDSISEVSQQLAGVGASIAPMVRERRKLRKAARGLLWAGALAGAGVVGVTLTAVALERCGVRVVQEAKP